MLWAGKDSVPRKRILTIKGKTLPGKHRQDLCIGQNERAKGEIFFCGREAAVGISVKKSAALKQRKAAAGEIKIQEVCT